MSALFGFLPAYAPKTIWAALSKAMPKTTTVKLERSAAIAPKANVPAAEKR